MQQELSNEIISAEIVFSSKNDVSKISLQNNDYSQELNAINQRLGKYVNHADRYDYLVAVASGILCGVMDAQVADITKKVLNSKEMDLQGKIKESLKTAPDYLEKKFGKTSMGGMTAALLGSCMKKDVKSLLVESEETGTKEFDTAKAMEIFGSAAITAMLRWLAANRKPEEIDESDFPEQIKKLLHQVNNHPKVKEFLKNPRIPEITPETFAEIGIPAVFISLITSKIGNINQIMKKAGSFPKNTVQKGLSKIKKREINTIILQKLADQVISVLANEIIVRGFYFVRHLIEEIDRCGDIDRVNWESVIPFDNKTIIRMLTVSSLTFTAADMSVAAVRAAVEAGGINAVTAQKYLTNINVIGVGRAIVAVTRDVSMEWQEADLIRERRELAEKVSAEQVEAILAYRKQMENVVEEYLAEDLQVFLTGADEIEHGISLNDSDQVIHGNVTIQRILGRKPQFSNQEEFDDLMNSADALVL